MKVRAWICKRGELPFHFHILPWLGYAGDSFGRSIYFGWLMLTIEFELWSLFKGERNG